MAGSNGHNGNGNASFPGISHLKKRAFLAAYCETGNVRLSSEIARIDRRTHTNWRRDDEAYAAAFRMAKAEASDVLEAEARRRAVEGVRKLRVNNGAVVMVPKDLTKPFHETDNPAVPLVEHEYSDTLLIFLLKGNRPGKFRDNIHHEHAGAVRLYKDVAGVSRADL